MTLQKENIEFNDIFVVILFKQSEKEGGNIVLNKK